MQKLFSLDFFRSTIAFREQLSRFAIVSAPFQYKLLASFRNYLLKLEGCAIWLSFLPYLNRKTVTILFEIFTLPHYQCLLSLILFLIKPHLLRNPKLQLLHSLLESTILTYRLLMLIFYLLPRIKVFLSQFLMPLLLLPHLLLQIIQTIPLIIQLPLLLSLYILGNLG